MSGLWEAERAVLTREVDRLTRELADCEAHLTGARRDFEAASRVMLERHEAELAAETELRKLAQQSLVSAGTEHARDLGHLADRNRELAKRDEVTKLLALRVADAELGLAERTRERDDALHMKGVYDSDRQTQYERAEKAERERDDAQRAHIRSLFASSDHVMARGAPFGDPVRCTTHEQVAAVFGWGYLYPEEPQPLDPD